MPDLSDQATLSAPAALAGSAPGRVLGGLVQNEPTTFTLYRHGEVTVIGWDGEADADADPTAFLHEAADLVTGANASVLAVDLTGLTQFRPGLLGGLASIVRRGTRVLLFNPTEDVRDLLRVSRLDRLLSVHAVELNG